MEFPRGTDSAKVIAVIETVSVRGSGKSQNSMIRPIKQYWSLFGELLAENDPCTEEKGKESISKAGKYEQAGKEAMQEGSLNFSGNKEMAILSLKALDTISENTKDLSAEYALSVLEDAKSILMQLLGV